MQPVTVGVAVGDEAVVLAAGIWSRATARRDASTAPDGADSALPGVRRRLALDGSTPPHHALEMCVIHDNTRAIAVFERAGWEPTGELVRDDTSGKLERRFVRCRS